MWHGAVYAGGRFWVETSMPFYSGLILTSSSVVRSLFACVIDAELFYRSSISYYLYFLFLRQGSEDPPHRRIIRRRNRSAREERRHSQSASPPACAVVVQVVAQAAVRLLLKLKVVVGRRRSFLHASKRTKTMSVGGIVEFSCFNCGHRCYFFSDVSSSPLTASSFVMMTYCVR